MPCARVVVRSSCGACLICASAWAATVYTNDFQGPPGSSYPEWSGGVYTYTGNQAGTIRAGSGSQKVTNVDSANGRQRFLGEFGGPAILTSPPYDPQHFTRVDQSVRLTLNNLAPHALVTVAFDLYILKSWDGNNPNYGPDRWKFSVVGGPTPVDATFSNNFKTDPYDLSLQDYPLAGVPPQTRAAAVNTLGYSFYGDSAYHIASVFPHSEDSLVLEFSSSLFEGKGLEDESWGLDNVVVSIDSPTASVTDSVVNAAGGLAGIASGAWVTILGDFRSTSSGRATSDSQRHGGASGPAKTLP